MQCLHTLVASLQEPVVRQTAATALLELYGVPDNMSPLDTFTDRFQTRYAELIYDVDEVVAVKGVRPQLSDVAVPERVVMLTDVHVEPALCMLLQHLRILREQLPACRPVFPEL